MEPGLHAAEHHRRVHHGEHDPPGGGGPADARGFRDEAARRGCDQARVQRTRSKRLVSNGSGREVVRYPVHAFDAGLGLCLRQHSVREVDRAATRFPRRQTERVASGAAADVKDVEPGNRSEVLDREGLFEGDEGIRVVVVDRGPAS